MMMKIHFAYVCLLINACIQSSEYMKRNYYRAGVLEMRPTANISNNLKRIAGQIRIAHENKVDILVLPEYAVVSLETEVSKAVVEHASEVLPPVNSNLCESRLEQIYNISKSMGCAAMDFNMYIVVNMIERVVTHSGEDEYYNSNIVIDHAGNLILVYRKYNLFNSENLYFKKGANRAIPIFSTHFGVTFGTFICFDILFPVPALELIKKQVRDYIFTTAWMSEIPSLTAYQAHASWAMSHNVNLISANYHKLDTGICSSSGLISNQSSHPGAGIGSGIYAGRAKSIFYLHDTVDNCNYSRLLVVSIPIEQGNVRLIGPDHNSQATVNSVNVTRVETLFYNVSNYTQALTNGLMYQQLCHGSLCCSVRWPSKQMAADYAGKLVVLVYQDSNSTQRFTGMREQLCLVIQRSECNANISCNVTKTRLHDEVVNESTLKLTKNDNKTQTHSYKLCATGLSSTTLIYPSILPFSFQNVTQQMWNYNPNQKCLSTENYLLSNVRIVQIYGAEYSSKYV